MRFILGVDPGKEGAFVLINEAGQIIDTERMEYDGSTLSATATARTYKRFLDFVHAYEGEHKEASTLTVFIEKGHTRPSDATSEAYIAKLESILRSVVMRAGNLSDSTVMASEAFQPILGEIDEARRMIPSGGRGRTDGRKGTFSYGKSCGILEICAAYEIPYVLVSPATWCAAMHKGADSNIKAKERSKQIVSRLWPQYAQKGSPLWPSRCKSFHLGFLDAFMVAQWGLKYG
jgi:hypothetical protein